MSYIQYKSKSDLIAEKLTENIRLGLYEDGKLPREVDLADQFEVSRMTLRGALDILDRKKLIKKIKGTGTFLNSSQDKAINISSVVGVVLPTLDHYTSPLYDAIVHNLSEKSLFSVFIKLPSYDETELNFMKKLDNLLNSNIRGIIVHGNAYKLYPQLRNFVNSNVAIQTYSVPGPFPKRAVLADFERATFIATEHLIKLGRKNIVLLANKPGHYYQMDKVERSRCATNLCINGYQKALQKNELQQQAETIFYHSPEGNDPSDLIRGILARKNHPEGFVCVQDNYANHVINIACQTGLKVPEDLAVIGMYNTPWCENSFVKITSISLNEELIAKEAVELMVSPRTQKKQKIVIEPKLIIRESCGGKNNNRERENEIEKMGS